MVLDIRFFWTHLIRGWVLTVLLTFSLAVAAVAHARPAGDQIVPAVDLTWMVAGGAKEMQQSFPGSKGLGQFHWHRSAVGDTAQAMVPVPTTGRYEVLASVSHDQGSGRFRVSVGDGVPTVLDLYLNHTERHLESLGTFDLPSGTANVRFETLVADARSSRGWNGLNLDSFILRRIGDAVIVPKKAPATPPKEAPASTHILVSDLEWKTTGGLAETQPDFAGVYGKGQFYWSGAKVGDTAQVRLDIAVAGRYDLLASLGHDRGSGRFRIFVGDRAPVTIDLYDGSVERILGPLGTFDLPQGSVVVRFEVLNPNSRDIWGLNALALDYFMLRGVNAPMVGTAPTGIGMIVAPPAAIPGGTWSALPGPPWKVEGESLRWNFTGGLGVIQSGSAQLSEGRQFWWRGESVGAVATTRLTMPVAGRYLLLGYFGHAPDYGRFQVYVGNVAAGIIDLYQPTLQWRPEELGTFDLPAGEVTIRFEALSPNPRSRVLYASKGFRMLGVDFFTVQSYTRVGNALVPQAPVSRQVRIEGESLTWNVLGSLVVKDALPELSGNACMAWRDGTVGSVGTTTLNIPVAGRYDLGMNVSHHEGGGRFRIAVANVSPLTLNLYHPSQVWSYEALGTYDFPAGKVLIQFQVLDPDSRSNGRRALFVDYFQLVRR